MGKHSFTRAGLENFKPVKKYFAGIDSDGCVFDTMEIKQKLCFHAVSIKLWQLEAIESYARETLEFVNLYSQWRGQNRFISQALAFDMLRKRPPVRESGVHVPELRSLKKLIASGMPLSNDTLQQAVKQTKDRELQRCLEWSRAVNEEIARKVKKIPPFSNVRRGMAKIRRYADVVCVSQTPTEALVREWADNDLLDYVDFIAGQELGTKSEHLELAAGGRYPCEHVLMIGDAPGDLKAAAANKACFFPIAPGNEPASWKRLHDEGLDLFLEGAFAGEYQRKLIDEFNALLPSVPPWEIAAS